MKIVTNGKFYRIANETCAGFIITSEGIYQTRFLCLAKMKLALELSKKERSERMRNGPWTEVT